MRDRQPVWSRRKEILLGTQAKVNPTRTMARRASLIAREAGPATSYYFWLIERIGSGESTRFKIEEAAEANGVNRRAIERYNTHLTKIKFITVTTRYFAGKQTYSEYTLHPINEIIRDDGKAPADATTKVSQRGYDKSVATKRALKGEQGETAGQLPQAAQQAEAGRPSDNRPASCGPSKEEIQRFIREQQPTILQLGFQPRPDDQTVRDIQSWLDRNGDGVERWEAFHEMWPFLQAKLKSNEFLKKSKNGLGFGWLFRLSKSSPEESNLDLVLNTNRWDSLDLPSMVYDTGALVMHQGVLCRVLKRMPDSLTRYRVHPAKFTSPEDIEASWFTVSIKEITDADPAEHATR